MPPTEDAVATMIAGGPLPGDEVLGIMPPVEGTVTVEKVAANGLWPAAARIIFRSSWLSLV